uniref:Uncharacterized protein n=1 Tax=Lotus japonicus TaxID=34305 RepID=I3SYG3_LOTJA|nr:unknown [Lotus japonicus]
MMKRTKPVDRRATRMKRMMTRTMKMMMMMRMMTEICVQNLI